LHTVLADTPRAERTVSRGAAAPFPAAKLLPPALPTRLVHRPRLHELLERGTLGLVTLVSAHAGTGKTVLLSSWAAASDRRGIAWLGLDRDDNWSPRFWLGVERALAGAGAFDGHPPEPAGTASATRIAERLDGLAQPVVLVLDDFHEIESPIVRRELQALLDRSPSGLRVVISTRAVIPGFTRGSGAASPTLTLNRTTSPCFTPDAPISTTLPASGVSASASRWIVASCPSAIGTTSLSATSTSATISERSPITMSTEP